MQTGRSAREQKFAYKQRRRVILTTTYTRGVNNERKRKCRRVQRRIAAACYKAAAASRATERLAALATVQATMPVADAMVGAFELACKRYGHSLVDMIAIAPPVRAAKSVPL